MSRLGTLKVQKGFLNIKLSVALLFLFIKFITDVSTLKIFCKKGMDSKGSPIKLESSRFLQDMAI